jgi:hypothetical protein
LIGQRHDPAMLDLVFQFTLELFRALLVDALSGHVRRRVMRMFIARNASWHRVLLGVHRRTRKRLLHRLLTEIEQDL